MKHLELVLRKIQEEKLTVNLEKSEFMKEELVYFGFVVSQGSLKMDKDKSFRGLAQFYRMFVRRFSEINAPMMDTIKGGMKTKFMWTKSID